MSMIDNIIPVSIALATPSRRESIFYCGLFTKSGGSLQSIQFSPLVFFTLC
jgi:hypothetical protein